MSDRSSRSSSAAAAVGRRHRRPAVAVLLGAFALVASLLPASSLSAQTEDTVTAPVAASSAAAWLAEQTDSIPVDMVPGSPSWGATLDVGLALVSAGVGSDAVERIWEQFVAHRDTAVMEQEQVSAGSLAKAILLAVATDRDPRDVGDAPEEDLVERLQNTLQTSTGLFGAADATYDGTYRQGLAILALDAASDPIPPSAIDWLLDQQCDDSDFGGAWMPNRDDTDEPCAPDPVMFTAPDTNSTALAVAALSVVGSHDTEVGNGLDWLASVRLDEGGWENAAGWGMDPNSTAVVMQALVTAEVADEERFASAPTPADALMTYFLDCTAPEADRGTFTYPGTGDAPNLMATVAAVPAIGGQGLVISAPSDAPGDTLSCDEPTTTDPDGDGDGDEAGDGGGGGDVAAGGGSAPAQSPGGVGASRAGSGRPISFVG